MARGQCRESVPEELEVIDLRPDPPAPPPPPPTKAPLPSTAAGAAPAPPRPNRLPPLAQTDVAFRRWVFTPYDTCLDRLAAWGTDRTLGRSRLVLTPAISGGPDRRRLTVLLGRGWRRPPCPMELVLDRWEAPFGLQLTLRPLGEVRAGRRYFREGHALLSSVQAVLEG